jgi:hypothetical protein
MNHSFNLSRDLELNKYKNKDNDKDIINNLKLENVYLRKRMVYVIEQERIIYELKEECKKLKLIIDKINKDNLKIDNYEIKYKKMESENIKNLNSIKEYENKEILLRKCIIKIINDLN